MSLLSVDELVGAIVDMLSAHALLEKTFIFFASDHGSPP
jgi:arylsulfatase A-like enzyme